MVYLKGHIFWIELNDCCKMLCFHEKKKVYLGLQSQDIEREIVVCSSPPDKEATVVGL